MVTPIIATRWYQVVNSFRQVGVSVSAKLLTGHDSVLFSALEKELKVLDSP